MHRMQLREDPAQEYYLYLPTSGARNASIFVTVHGISENWDTHANLYQPFAETYGVVLISPHFPQTRYTDYQRLTSDNGERADYALQKIVKEVRELTQASTGKFYLFGYSGGAQFTHRYAMAHPEEIARYAVGAAGWYTFPDTTYTYPYGIRNTGQLPGVTFDPNHFLLVPGAVMVGDLDIELDSSLNQDAAVNAQQGTTRYERGQRWIEAMLTQASQRGLTTPYEFHSLPGCAHSFSDCMKKSGMGQTVFNWLFGAQTDI